MHDAPQPLLREYPRTDPRLGRKLQLDARSLPFMVTAAAPRTLRSVHWPRPLPILDQGDLGACVGFAATGALGSVPLASFEHAAALLPDAEMARAFARDLYSETTAIDPFDGAWPPEDTGTDGLSVCKVLKRRGVISSYRWASSLAGLVTLLQDGPVLMGMPWHAAFYEPDAETGRIDPTGWEDSELLGGHEVEIVGVRLDPSGDLERAVFLVANSWGAGWGMAGYFTMGGRTYTLMRDHVDLVQPQS